jgi:hypothetical protein
MQFTRRLFESLPGFSAFGPVVPACALALVLSSCNAPSALAPVAGTAATSTSDRTRIAAQIETSASAALTQTPTPPSADTPTHPAPTISPTRSSAVSSTAPCSDRAAFVDDVTIRDNSLVMPGEAFVKIWRLQNTGTCIWDTTYAIAFIGGERMQASSPVALTTTVPPRSTVDLAADMVAPQQPGSYQGYWNMIGRDGDYFGIGADADVAFWVKIVVPAIPTETGMVAPSLTPTASATPKPTPEVVISGVVSIRLHQSLDLDGGHVDPPSGLDISLLESTPGSSALVPAEGAPLSRYGPPPDPPSPSRCQALTLSDDPIPLSSLSVQSLVCYRTTAGRLGYFRVKNLDDALTIEFVTWGP